jgi:hypothetical protein
MAVRDLCVSSCDAPPWIRFAGDGRRLGAREITLDLRFVVVVVALGIDFQSHNPTRLSAMRASNCKKARRNESVLHFYNGRREKEAVCVCMNRKDAWMTQHVN